MISIQQMPIAAIFELVKFANTHGSGESSKGFIQYLFDTIVRLSDVLGLLVDKEEEMLDEDVEKQMWKNSLLNVRLPEKKRISNGQTRSETSLPLWGSF